ncbi:hypothetical protein C6A85_77415, partial [Mycobacterium sp. ITM-2017-0098]
MPTSAGWHGYGDLQHTTEEAVRMNVRTVADRVIDVVPEPMPNSYCCAVKCEREETSPLCLDALPSESFHIRRARAA